MFGDVLERVTSVRASPEALAKLAADKILFIGDKSHPVIRDQAHAFKRHIEGVTLQYIQRAVFAEQLNVSQVLRDLGHPELVAAVTDRMKAM